MSKKKYIIAITSLSLVIVALVGAVIGIWAATQTVVKSTLYVSYTPTKDVIATVTASYFKKGDSKVTQIGTKSWGYRDAAGTNNMDAKALTLDDTNDTIVFEFKFQNDASASQTQSARLNVSESGSPAAVNMNVTKKYSNSPIDSLTETNFTALQNKTNSVLSNIVTGTPVYIYVMVQIKTKGVPASWGNASNSAFTFTLTATPAT